MLCYYCCHYRHRYYNYCCYCLRSKNIFAIEVVIITIIIIIIIIIIVIVIMLLLLLLLTISCKTKPIILNRNSPIVEITTPLQQKQQQQ